MRQLVGCLNCGLKWVRVTAWGSTTEPTEDIQYYCPKCGSNYFKPIEDKDGKIPFSGTRWF